jgi:hypothetical protein
VLMCGGVLCVMNTVVLSGIDVVMSRVAFLFFLCVSISFVKNQGPKSKCFNRVGNNLPHKVSSVHHIKILFAYSFLTLLLPLITQLSIL